VDKAGTGLHGDYNSNNGNSNSSKSNESNSPREDLEDEACQERSDDPSALGLVRTQLSCVWLTVFGVIGIDRWHLSGS
jgi:hypothetical protein